MLASPMGIFFTSYLGEKSQAVWNKSRLRRAKLGIAADTCSNKKHGLHLQHGKLFWEAAVQTIFEVTLNVITMKADTALKRIRKQHRR